MNIESTIALLMLVIAAMSFGFEIGKKKYPPPEPSEKRQFQNPRVDRLPAPTGRAVKLLFTSYHERGEKSIENQEKPKRKTHTSSEVKRRYHAKTYTRIALAVRNEITTATARAASPSS